MEKKLIKSVEEYVQYLRELLNDQTINFDNFEFYPDSYPCVVLSSIQHRQRNLSSLTEQTWDEITIGFAYPDDFEE